MRVLGIDPGTRVLGYGVVEQQGNSLRALDHGTVSPGDKLSLERRLHLIFQGITAVIDAARPDAVAIEGLFSHKNARSALVLGHARGVALLCAARAGLEVFEYAPAEVKKAIGAPGNAEKEQVVKMVRGFLGVERIDKFDAADALALAVCHLNRHRFTARLASAVIGGRR
ncbi:MAG: crossover junction endodeoxyribonuclease RuvC [Deltaproteobacteria bacterium]|nr:crossover junction endodeoxyribonuclease RuvC [Deltaproteobacteria bacterium]